MYIFSRIFEKRENMYNATNFYIRSIHYSKRNRDSDRYHCTAEPKGTHHGF